MSLEVRVNKICGLKGRGIRYAKVIYRSEYFFKYGDIDIFLRVYQ